MKHLLSKKTSGRANARSIAAILAASCLTAAVLTGCSSGKNAPPGSALENETAAEDEAALKNETAPENKTAPEGEAVPNNKTGSEAGTGSKGETGLKGGTGLAAEASQKNPGAVLSDSSLIITGILIPGEETPHLEPDASYYFDLDGDGAPEKIRYTLTPTGPEEWQPFDLHIFIDEAEIFTGRNLYVDSGNVYITDVDTSDSLLEIHCQWTSDSACMEIYNFIRYENGTVTNFGDLSDRSVLYGKGHLYRNGKTVLNGDGTFLISADTPVYSETVGCYYVPLTFALTEGGVSEVIKDEYDYIMPYASPYNFSAVTEFDAFTAAGGGEIAFHVFPGESVTFKKLKFRDDGSIFALAVNGQGKEGWISASGQTLFEEIPAWG